MLDLTRDFQSLSFFRRKTASLSKMLRKSQRPLVLTHNGKPELVVQSVTAYQRLLDIAARQDADEGIRQGLQDAKEGRSRPASEFFAQFEAKHGL